MMVTPPTFLLLGYGNPGRLDDGLGPALAAGLEEHAGEGLTIDADYQLMVEDAKLVAEHDVVIFADAAVDGPEPFYLRPLEPKAQYSFSTHSVEPAAVLGLAHELFAAHTRGYILGIRGYCFNDFGETLSPAARRNLEAAHAFIEDILRRRDSAALEAHIGREHQGDAPVTS